MAVLAYPETVKRAVRIIHAHLARRPDPVFPFRLVRGEFARVGLSVAALARLVELGMLEAAPPAADGNRYRPTGHEIWRAAA